VTTANAKALGREKRARKASSKSAQRKACDVAFSLWVRSIGVCEAAGEGNGCKGNLQCAHVLTRGYSTIRWDPRNALSLCAGHHIFYTHRPAEWRSFVIATLGEAHWDMLYELARTPAPRPDYPVVLAEIRARPPRGDDGQEIGSTTT
jgi:hypothetical protein